MGGKEPEVTDGLRSFGAVVRGFRRRAGLSQCTLGERIGYSEPQVSAVERGRRFPRREFAERTDEELEAEGIILDAYKPLQQRKGLAPRFQGWSEVEDEARTLYAYECRVIPGLLQPESYVRAVFESNLPPLTEEQIDAQTAARLERHRLLRDRPNTEFGFIIEQAVLERRMGGTEVTRELIDHLLEAARLRNVELLIMPLRQERHCGSAGPMYLAETPENERLGYVEGHECSMLISDRNDVGILYQRYGKMRSQALSQEDSIGLLERMRGEL
jgi:transcriptional regulator with XRE-family HTH domain